MASAPVLSDLADTLAALAATGSLEADRADDRVDSTDSLADPTDPGDARAVAGELADWGAVRAAVRERFAPLNHVADPSPDGPGSIVTVAPQDEPEIKLQVTASDGGLDVRASFTNPRDGSWEPLYDGPAAEYDDAEDERTRNRIVYITEAWVRADELRDETVLTARQSQVQALAEAGHPADRIAEVLDLAPETVEATLAGIDERVEAARTTVEMLG